MALNKEIRMTLNNVILYVFMSKNKKSIIRNTIIVLVVIFMAYLVICMVLDCSIVGYKFRKIGSESMTPVIMVGDLCIIDVCTIEDIEVGDIICYRTDDIQNDIVHRVVGLDEKDNNIVLYTKGDNNKIDDEIDVTSDMLVGKIVGVLSLHRGVITDLSMAT